MLNTRIDNIKWFLASCLLVTLILVGTGCTWTPRTDSPQLGQHIEQQSQLGTRAGFFPTDTNAYQVNAGQFTTLFTPQGATIALETATLHVDFVGANRQPQLVGQAPLSAKTHVYIGNDATQWRENVPTYQSIVYRELYPGIDLSYTVENGHLKSEFIVQPEANPGQIRVHYTGVTTLTLDSTGKDLLIALPSGDTLKEHLPIAYQNICEQQKTVDVSFQLVDETTYRFVINGPWDPTQPLIIDPLLRYATYLGGTEHDEGWAVTVDKDGNTLVTGITYSASFAATAPSTHHYRGAPGKDVFITKFNSRGELVYTTFIGGTVTNSGEEGNGIATDAIGNAYVAGETYSADFPMLNAWQPQFGGYEDAYILKLSPTGLLLSSTFIGGTGPEEANDIAVDAAGNIYIAGEVYSDDFPLLNPLQSTAYGAEDEDGFISIFDPNGQLTYSTFVNATARDQLFRIAVDGNGNVYAVGMTSSPNFPVANAVQSQYGGGWEDCLVLKLDPWTNTLFYATFLGGNDRDACWGIDVDADGYAYITGYSQSTDFPLVDSLQTKQGGNEKDVFVTKLTPNGNQIIYSSFIAGQGRDASLDLTLDSDNRVYIVGYTNSADFPQVNALQPQYHGGVTDGFLLQLTADGALEYASFIGGSDADRAWGVSVGTDLTVHVIGATDSSDLQLKSPAQDHPAGNGDIFVAQFGIAPTHTPTPTPTPTSTPTPTPTPFVNDDISPEGGVLQLAYPYHTTTLTTPAGILSTTTPMTLTYQGWPDPQGELQGINHFFAIYAELPGTTPWLPTRFNKPLQLTLDYQETRGVIEGTLSLYRLSASGWSTDNITQTHPLPGYIVADIEWLGTYGLLGDTNRVYLPITLRTP